MLFMFNTINLIKDIGILENLVRQSKSREKDWTHTWQFRDLVRSAASAILALFTEHIKKLTLPQSILNYGPSFI